MAFFRPSQAHHTKCRQVKARYYHGTLRLLNENHPVFLLLLLNVCCVFMTAVKIVRFLFQTSNLPGGGGGSIYKKGRDARREF